MFHQFWQRSKCLNSYLHRFKIVAEYPDGVTENCEICHKSKFFKIVDGKVDHHRYMSYHLRQALGNIPIPNYIWHEYEYKPLEEDKIKSPYA